MAKLLNIHEKRVPMALKKCNAVCFCVLGLKLNWCIQENIYKFVVLN